MLEQYAAESLVGEDAGEVVDPTISLGFANNSNDFVGLEQPAGDAFFKAGGVGNGLQFDFENFNRHCFLALGWRGASVEDAAQFLTRDLSSISPSSERNAFDLHFHSEAQLHAASGPRRRIFREELAVYRVHVFELKHIVEQHIDLDDAFH